MDKNYQNVKLWISTIENLRLIYGLTSEKMVAIVDRLVKVELERIQKQQKSGTQPL